MYIAGGEGVSTTDAAGCSGLVFIKLRSRACQQSKNGNVVIPLRCIFVNLPQYILCCSLDYFSLFSRGSTWTAPIDVFFLDC